MTAVGGRDVVIDHGKGLARLAHLAAGHAQTLKRLRAGHFMHQVAVNIEQTGSVRLHVDRVVVPNLVVKRPCRGHGSLLSQAGLSRFKAAPSTFVLSQLSPGMGLLPNSVQ
jgi:hypothetical protein